MGVEMFYIRALLASPHVYYLSTDNQWITEKDGVKLFLTYKRAVECANLHIASDRSFEICELNTHSNARAQAFEKLTCYVCGARADSGDCYGVDGERSECPWQ